MLVAISPETLELVLIIPVYINLIAIVVSLGPIAEWDVILGHYFILEIPLIVIIHCSFFNYYYAIAG